MTKLKVIQFGLLTAGLIFFTTEIVLAHFDVGTKVRQLVLTETGNTTEVYIRTPIPLLFGDILNGETDEYGFLVNRGTNESRKLYLSWAQIQASRAAFTTRLTNSLQWHIGFSKVGSRVRAYRILPAAPELELFTSATASASLNKPPVISDVAIGTGYIDMLVSVAAVAQIWPLRLQMGLPPVELPEGVVIDNQIVDERTGKRRNYSRQGQLARALTLPRSSLGWTVGYVYQGMLHIFAGIDHVLLLIAMSLGVAQGMALVRLISAFTLGHAITIAAGFLGYVPQVPWFIPLIESAIAATIIVAAASSLLMRNGSALLYIAVGLLHGFGFSFVLANALGRNSTELLPSMAAFTVGIEIGQLFIIFFVLSVLFAFKKILPEWVTHARGATLIILGLVAVYMLAERIPTVYQSTTVMATSREIPATPSNSLSE